MNVERGYSLRDDQELEKLQVGLPNIGNTCFMNSALNVILKQPLKEFDSFIFQDNADEDTILLMYQRLLAWIYTNEKNFAINNHLQKLKSIIGKRVEMYSLPTEEDSMDFYRNLIRLLSMEIDEKNIKRKCEDISLEIGSELSSPFQFKHYVDSFYQNNKVRETFYMTLIKILPCDLCEFKSYSLEFIIDLTIQLCTVKNSAQIDIYSLLDKFFSVQSFENGCQLCEKCHKEGVSKIGIKILYLPQIISILIDRYDYSTKRKDGRKIRPLKAINFSRYLFDEGNIRQNPLYSIYGSINHFGGYRGGHYVNYIKYGRNWIKFSDSNAEKSSMDEMVANVSGLFLSCDE